MSNPPQKAPAGFSSSPGRVRIVGGGLAGIALADALLQRGLQVELVEKSRVAAGASGAASGLLHPLPGLRALPGWQAQEAFRLARLSVEQRAQSHPGIVGTEGVFRPASARQRDDFRRAAQQGWGIWCSAGPPCALPSALAREGLWIPEGCVVDVPLYLQVWVEQLQQKGLQLLFQEELAGREGAEDSAPESIRVWCTGHQLQPLLPVRCAIVRGQALVVQPPKQHKADLGCGVAGRAYLAASPEGWIVGATFEHERLDLEPDAESAIQALSARVEELWPGHSLFQQPILSIHVGHRLSSPDHLPLCGQLPNGEWVLAGLGSRGLLYHVLVAQHCAEAICAGDDLRIPSAIHLRRFGSSAPSK